MSPQPRRRSRSGGGDQPPREINGNGNGGGSLPPAISSIAPTSGPPATPVTLTGIRFEPRADFSAVSFDPNAPDLGPVNGEIVSWTGTKVVVRVPTIASLGAAGKATVTLTNASELLDRTSFTVLDTDRPAIQSFVPAQALPGTELRILGVRFGVEGTAGTGVVFAGVSVPVVSWSRGEVRVRVPDAAAVGGYGPRPVQVSTPWGANDAAQFTIIEPPTVTAVTPAEAPPDASIAISGRGFDAYAGGVSSVELRYVDPDLGRTVVTPLELASWTPTEIRAFVPGLSGLKESGVKQLFIRTPLAVSASAAFSVIDVSSITSWTRIEPHARTDDLERGLGLGLRAEVADALWLLGRQWVLGELQGEDGGSPVATRVEGEAAPFRRFRPGAAGTAVDLPPAIPLETLVERERIFPPRGAGAAPFADRMLAAEAGLHYLRLLARQLPPTQAQTYRRRYVELYAFAAPTAQERAALDPAAGRFLAVMAGRALDGARLYTQLAQALPPARGGTGQLPADPPIRDADRDAVLAAIADWFTWTETLTSAPAPGQTAWDRERLEYAFAVAAETTAGEIVLEAPEYADGRLDWYAFRRGTGSLRSGTQAAPAVVPLAATMVPAPVAFPGMPSPRWWELEEARVDFGAVDAGPPDLARLLFVEFATVFGNDWFSIPLAGVPFGSVVRITAVRVTDTFGEVTTVTPFRETGPGGAWRLFQPSGDPTDSRNLLVVPATVAGALESAPVEEVVFVRDELANMAWAVEKTVAGATGHSSSRQEMYEHARRSADAQLPVSASANGPPVYRLMSTIQDFWVPFVPQRDGATPRLLRAALRRPLPDGTLLPIPPVGRILEPETATFRVFDIEVPPEGARVTRTWQLTRDAVGGTHLWLGRQKDPMASIPSSGLRFDLVEEAGAPGT